MEVSANRQPVEVLAHHQEAVRSANRQAVEVLARHQVVLANHQAVGLEVKALNPNRHQEAAGFH